jgi:hypothetical protein
MRLRGVESVKREEFDEETREKDRKKDRRTDRQRKRETKMGRGEKKWNDRPNVRADIPTRGGGEEGREGEKQ